MNNSKSNSSHKRENSLVSGTTSNRRFDDSFLDRVLEDRFSRGFLAGAVSYFPQLIWLIIAMLIGFTELIYSDFASILVYGRFAQDIYEYVFAEFIVVFWHGFLGVIFAFLLPVIKSKNLYFKGWFYGNAIWFASYVVTTLFQVPELGDINLKTSISNMIGASIQGLFLGFAFIYLEKKKVG
ncbi:MAG TPA: hypothetical protein DEF42_05240 [Desulfosporosinus sp.]|nr:hypothetical protein [Desulfosporosinus sp.]